MVIWVAKTSNYTVSANDGILADTATTGAFTVTLPATPTAGDTVGFLDAKNNLAIANLTIGCNGEKIEGIEDDMLVNVNGANFYLVYSGSTMGWCIVSKIPGTGWLTKTADYTAKAMERIQGDTSAGAFTITLPSTPAVGAEVEIIDQKGTFRTYNLTLGRNGEKIQGSAADFVCDIEDAALRIVYTGSTDGWKIFDLGVAGVGVGLPSASRGMIDGLTLSNAADTEHDITIAAGAARDSTDAYTLGLAAAITKQIDAAWAAGTNAGGLDTGSVGNNTWYHVWLIRKDSDGTIDALFSTSATAPTMPAGYTYKRRIGSVLTNGSANIIGFLQNGDKYLWKTPIADVTAGTYGTSRTLVTLTVPTGIKVVPIVRAYSQISGGYTLVWGSCSEQDNFTPASNVAGHVAETSSGGVISNLADFIWTDTSARIYIDCLAANNTIYLNTFGWIDPRGRDA